MPSFKSTEINFDQNRPKIKLFLQKNLERLELHSHIPEITLILHSHTRLALSDVEPRFQKLLKRNGNKCLIKLLFFCFCNYLVGSQLFLQTAFLSEFGRKIEWLRNTASAEYAEV